MTVRELMEILATMDPDSMIYIPAEGPLVTIEEVYQNSHNEVELG